MAEIKLYGGLVAIVDDQDANKLNKYTWYVQDTGLTRYAKTNLGIWPLKKTTMMHRMILGLNGPHPFVDHINGDGLDNRRSNLRLCSHTQNMHNQRKATNNTSGYKGVSRAKIRKSWRASIMVEGTRINLGSYENIEDAARAYDKAAKEYYGRFANLNFPD